MTEDVYYPLTETELYPKLLGDNLLESIEAKKRFLHEHGFRLQEVAHLCSLAIRSGNKIFIAGNGGSATDASHFAGEMLGRFVKERDALPCIFLGGDIAAMTAIANDYGYEYVFSRQLQGLARPGDVFIGISTSGNSKNILNAASLAKSLSCNVIGLTGGNGGGLAAVSDYLLNVAGSTKAARIQETHIWVLHCLAEMIEG